MANVLKHCPQFFTTHEQSAPIAERVIDLLLEEKTSYLVAQEALEIAMHGLKLLTVTKQEV